MLAQVAVPLRNLRDLVLYGLGMYIITKLSFPPNEPPPNFPFILPFDFGNREHQQDTKENSQHH